VERVAVTDDASFIISAGEVRRYDAVILAVPPSSAARLFAPARILQRSVGSLVKTRIWLGIERAVEPTFHVVPALGCRMYLFRQYAMFYADQEAATALWNDYGQDPDKLARRLCSALPEVCLSPRILGIKHWQDGVQFLTEPADARFGRRLAVANEAFSDMHGFVEGALASAEKAVDHLAEALSGK